MKKSCIIIIFIILFMTILIYNKEVRAIEVLADINSIDEDKYPGYKEKLQKLQTIYPKIKVHYTGLDWESVIKNETVHSRNLVPKNYGEEWRCTVCGEKLYDSGWYCASEEAVKYLMDPRIYLDEKNIFQFQKLDTFAGTLDKSIISLATQKNFLGTNENVNALYNAAEKNNINAIHLITRIIQEQGASGTSYLSSGKEYIGIDGIAYKGVYNLFSIGATGKNEKEVITNGLSRALEEGWYSRALSISGGTKFLKNKYLNRGQNTLYLQKFDVDDTYDGIYWHQYMQNLFAAKNEARLMYDTYYNAQIDMNKEFEFIIPIYENMPRELSKEPTAQYYGEINTDLKTMKMDVNMNGREYIYGEILIAEWINGIACIPEELPEMTLKSTDGEYSAGMYVKHIEGLKFYYDRVIHNLDTSKEYYIEVRLTNEKNISTRKKQIANIQPITEIGTFKKKDMAIKENKIIFKKNEYYGEINTDLKTMKMNVNVSGREYIYGEILIAEWIDEIAYVPKKLPQMTLKSTDGEYSARMYVKHIDGLKFYYDRVIHNLDTSKEYYIEVKLTSENNISGKTKQNANLQTIENIGIFKDKTIILRENKILFK